MAKIKGYNVRVYLGADMLMHTDEVTLNFDTDTEEVTDADSGDWAENMPTLNRWNIDTSLWYNNAVASGADFTDLMNAYLAQTELTITAELETGVEWTGLAYLTNLSPAGGTGAGYVKVSAAFIGTGDLS